MVSGDGETRLDPARSFPEAGYLSPVYVYGYGLWGIQCPTIWGELNANVTCQEHGYSGGLPVTFAQESYSQPYLEGYVCEDQTVLLRDCTKTVVNCGVKQLAGVFCYQSKSKLLFWYYKSAYFP